jgi:hypothetical protein
MFIHKHFTPPALITLSNKRYIIPTWVEVPLDTSLSDITWERVTPKAPIKKEPKIIVETFVSSSNSSILYKTKKVEREDGSFTYSCTCPGAWRAKDKRCKHIKILEKKD